MTGALPSGRSAGEPFAPGIGSTCESDHSGPTALLNSATSLDTDLLPNGTALNLRFDPRDIAGERGIQLLMGLARAYFERGGRQMQINVLDPEMLEDARAHPGKYPEFGKARDFPDDILRWPVEMIKEADPRQLKEQFLSLAEEIMARIRASGESE